MVDVAMENLHNDKDPTCNEEDSPTDWKSRVNKYNSQEKCTGTRLYNNMNDVATAHEEKGLGVVPEKVPGTSWNLDLITKTFFPVQAHHLIPKNYLPNHSVCVWLAIKYKDDDNYELASDSCYDTDDADNGYCMPYATPTKEWKSASDQSKKTAVVFKVMKKVGIQLHQGSHAKLLDPKKLKELAGEAIVPEISKIAGGAGSDDDEEASIHSPGYLDKIELLLNVVDVKALSHVVQCNVCKKKTEGNKTLVQPLEAVVKLMHRVSAITKTLIDANIVFVSGYAYFYAYDKKYLSVKDGRVYVKGTTGQDCAQEKAQQLTK